MVNGQVDQGSSSDGTGERRRKTTKSTDLGLETPHYKARLARSFLRRFAAQYDSADIDGTRKVTFQQFMTNIFPDEDWEARKEWRAFCHLDHTDDENDPILKSDFFFLALASVSRKLGTGVKTIFEAFDTDKSGMVDEIEFGHCMQNMGFADVGATVFHRHCKPARERTGETVHIFSYVDVISEVTNMWTRSKEMKFFLGALAENGEKKPLDSSGWEWTAEDADEVRETLIKIIQEHSIRLSDVFQAMDEDESFSLSYFEIDAAMREMGFKGNAEAIDDVWKCLDVDKSKMVSFEEFNCWLYKREVRTEKSTLVDALSLKLRVEASLDADFGVWTVKKLKQEIFELLKASGLQTMDMLVAWDTGSKQSGRGTKGDMLLSRREYMSHMKKLVGDNGLWYSIVRECAAASFRKIDQSKDGAISRNELARFFDPDQLLMNAGVTGAKTHVSEEERARRLTRPPLWAPVPRRPPPRYWWPGQPEVPPIWSPRHAKVHKKATMCIPAPALESDTPRASRTPPAPPTKSPDPPTATRIVSPHAGWHSPTTTRIVSPHAGWHPPTTTRIESPTSQAPHKGWHIVKASIKKEGVGSESNSALMRWKMLQTIKAAQKAAARRKVTAQGSPRRRPPDLSPGLKVGRRAPPGAPPPYKPKPDLDELTQILMKDLRRSAKRAAAPLQITAEQRRVGALDVDEI